MRLTLLVLFFSLTLSGAFAQSSKAVMKTEAVPEGIELKDPEIKIFPVPVVNGRFTISSDIPFTFVRMTNIIGQEITRDRINYPVSRRVIEFTTTEKGIYLITIELEDKRKIVKKILVDNAR